MENAAYVSDKTDPIPNDAISNGDVEKSGVHHQEELADQRQKFDYDEDAERRKQDQRDQDPLFFCRWITTYPKTFFGLTLGAHLMLVVISVVLIIHDYNLIPIKFSGLPLYIPGDVDYQRSLAWVTRDDGNAVIERTKPGIEEGTEPERSLFGDILELYYHYPGGNVFTKENLQAMKDLEDQLYQKEAYLSDYCLLEYQDNPEGECSRVTSVLRYFDGTYNDTHEGFWDPHFDDIPAVLHLANTMNTTKRGFQYHLAENAVITPDSATSMITRSRIVMGWPLAPYNNTEIEEDKQLEEIKDFQVDNFLDIVDKKFKDGVGEMDFFYGSRQLLTNKISKQVIMDMSLAFGSLIFIVIFVLIQTGSFWVTLLAVLSILTSFLGANFIYRVVLDYQYLGIFHVLTIFIILGIGADNIFIVFDSWKESSFYSYNSLAHRMSDVYRKSALAMLFTSTTTAVAFIVSATSPFIVVSSFGVFAGILVAVNYISIIIYFPTVVVTYHLFWDRFKCCCCCIKTEEYQQRHHEKKNFLVRFFSNHYYRFMTHKVYRWFVLIFFLLLIGASIYFATQLKPNEEQTKFLKDNTNFGKYLHKRNLFTQSDGSIISKVYLVWGFHEQDLSKCHKTDVECDGITVWDENFHMGDEETQTALMDLCVDLLTLSDDEMKDLAVRRNIVTGLPEVDCFALELKEFLEHENEANYTSPADPTTILQKYPDDTPVFEYPVSRSSVLQIMSADGNSAVYAEPDLDTNFPADWNHFLTSTTYWMFNGFEGKSKQFQKYDELIGEGKTHYTIKAPEETGFSYYYGTKIKYMAISINTTLQRATLGYPKGLKVRDAWEEYLDKQKKSLPDSLQGGFQITPPPFPDSHSLWHWLKIQELLVQSAVRGVLIGVCLSLPILTIATHNIIIGLMATFIICCITVSVLGMMPLLGWKLGLLESLNLVLVVGLAVDYVVHLAEGYSRSSHRKRLGRTHDMLQEVGISVLSGALTTLGASLFLLFAAILFFVQFGTFMFCTIGFSIIYSLGLFVPLMGLLGPENETGSLRPLYRWVAGKCCCRNSNNTTK